MLAPAAALGLATSLAVTGIASKGALREREAATKAVSAKTQAGLERMKAEETSRELAHELALARTALAFERNRVQRAVKGLSPEQKKVVEALHRQWRAQPEKQILDKFRLALKFGGVEKVFREDLNLLAGAPNVSKEEMRVLKKRFELHSQGRGQQDVAKLFQRWEEALKTDGIKGLELQFKALRPAVSFEQVNPAGLALLNQVIAESARRKSEKDEEISLLQGKEPVFAAKSAAAEKEAARLERYAYWSKWSGAASGLLLVGALFAGWRARKKEKRAKLKAILMSARKKYNGRKM